MRQLALTFVLIAALIGAVIAQEPNPNNWPKNQAEKMLNNSAWGQTQTETDLSEMVYTPTTGGGGRSSEARPLSDRQTVSNNRSERGATNQAIAVNYHVRLLSAKPVRLAFKRVIELAQGNKDPELLEGLDNFVKRDFSRFIVVAVTVDSTDTRFSGPVLQAFNAAGLQTLKNKAYLERKDGKRVFVSEYHAPINDGLGAKFIFPRIVDEKRFLEPDSGTLRFYCELTSQIKLNVTYKVSEMMYDGKLEY
jgi:hypothetical protein